MPESDQESDPDGSDSWSFRAVATDTCNRRVEMRDKLLMSDNLKGKMRKGELLVLTPSMGFMCQGTLRYPDGRTFLAIGEVELVVEDEIFCVIELNLQGAHPVLVLIEETNRNAPGQPEFTGTTDNGQPLKATRLAMMSLHPLRFSAGEVTVGVVSAGSRIQFFIPNLDMTPRNPSHEVPTDSYLVSFPGGADTQEANAELSVKPVGQVKRTEPGRNKNEESTINAVLTVSKSQGLLQWDSVEEPVYRLCLLLTLASGRHINWVIAQGEDWWLYRRHRVSGWGGRGTILNIRSSPESVRRLLNCWQKICSFSDEEALAFRRAVNLLLHSGPDYAFPVAFYTVAGAFEILSAAFLKSFQGGFLPEKGVFRRVRDSFRKWASEHFEPEVTEEFRAEFRDSVDSKFNGVNSRTLRARILALAQELDVAYSADSIRRFVKTRNSTVHGSDLTKQDEWELFAILAPMEHLLVRALLRLVGYSGEYWGGDDGFGTWHTIG